MHPAFRFRPALLAGALIAMSAAYAPARADTASADTASKAEAEIEARLAGWTEDFNARRFDRLCDLFAADLVADYQGQPQKNYASVCDGLVRLDGSNRSYHYGLHINEIIVSGDLAVVRLLWTLTVTGQGINGEAVVQDIGLDVFRRDSDGIWRIARYVAFPTTPQ